ncbi:NRT2.1, partial [Symbiodinium necroappetens]
CAGATFVTNQFWCSLMFAPNVVGTANATAAGWGNLGGGVTQIFMMSVLFNPMVASGMEPNVAWRDASALAGAFGLMNLFARSLGGISSDICYKYFGFRGRIWAQFLALFFEAIFLFSFGKVDNSQPWYVALAVLVCFSLFVQMAEGTSYGIVPFMNRKQLAVVSALVGAGGNLGAVTLGGNGANGGLLIRIAGFCFYKPIQDALLPFQVHAGYVMFWALLSPCYYWSEFGGMFHGPAQSFEKGKTQSSESESYTESEATSENCMYKDNGVLILVDSGDRQVEVEIGSGLNVAFKRDGWLRGMIDTGILPSLRHGSYDEGVLAGVTSCCQKLLETDREVSSPVRFRNRAWLLWGSSGVSAWLAAMLLLGRTFARPPKCSRCGGQMSRLREAEDAELQDGQKAEKAVGSAQHVLCVCKRPGCKASWAKAGAVRRLSGDRRLGGALERTSELKLTGQEVKEAAKTDAAIGILAADRWASRYRTCPACGYRTQLSRSFRNPVTGVSFKETFRVSVVCGYLGLQPWVQETECFFCNAYTCVEVQPVVTLSDGSTTGSTTSDVADAGERRVVATLGAVAAAMVAEKAETSEGEEHIFNADCDGSGRLLTPLLHDVKEAIELEGTVPEKHRLQHCGQDVNVRRLNNWKEVERLAAFITMFGRGPTELFLGEIATAKYWAYLLLEGGRLEWIGVLRLWKVVLGNVSSQRAGHWSPLRRGSSVWGGAKEQALLQRFDDVLAAGRADTPFLVVPPNNEQQLSTLTRSALQRWQKDWKGFGLVSKLPRDCWFFSLSILGLRSQGRARRRAEAQGIEFTKVVMQNYRDCAQEASAPPVNRSGSSLSPGCFQGKGEGVHTQDFRKAGGRRQGLRERNEAPDERLGGSKGIRSSSYFSKGKGLRAGRDRPQAEQAQAAAKQAAAIKAAEAKRNAAKKAAERAAEAKRIAAHKAAERAAEVKRIAAQKAEKAVSNQGALPSKTGKSPGLVRYIDSGPAAGWHVKGRAYPTAITMWVLPPNGSVWLSRVQALKELEESDPKVIEAIDRVRQHPAVLGDCELARTLVHSTRSHCKADHPRRSKVQKKKSSITRVRRI